MSVDTRIQIATDQGHAAKKALERAQEAADPVQQRREMVIAAKHFRMAADECDDSGRLEE
jgi:hypothetical protein